MAPCNWQTLVRSGRSAAQAGLGAAAALAASSAPGSAAIHPSGFVALSPNAPAYALALSDKMIFGGGLLVLFVIMAAVVATMWRDLGRGSRRS